MAIKGIVGRLTEDETLELAKECFLNLTADQQVLFLKDSLPELCEDDWQTLIVECEMLLADN